ncbi:MAG: hypothetical protein KatS3mg118_3095 [Paracoccaceae bacterium]|nr:MAG: hypothetical protein KatS3mg118_3095 [Paracoccaceae bacterium]
MAIALAGLLAAVVAMPVAPLLFRLRGAYFAIGTWVIAEVFRLRLRAAVRAGRRLGNLAARRHRAPRWPRGVPRARRRAYWLALGAALAVTSRSSICCCARGRGLALTAIRDNELAARSLGIDIWRTRFAVYVLVSALTAVVGALIFLQKLRISPDAAFSVNDWTAFVIFIVVIGGIGSIEGPIIGTLIFFALRETLADLGTIYLTGAGRGGDRGDAARPGRAVGLRARPLRHQPFPAGYRVRGLSTPSKESANGP